MALIDICSRESKMIVTIFEHSGWFPLSRSRYLSVFTPTPIGFSNGRLKQQMTWLVLGRRLETFRNYCQAVSPKPALFGLYYTNSDRRHVYLRQVYSLTAGELQTTYSNRRGNTGLAYGKSVMDGTVTVRYRLDFSSWTSVRFVMRSRISAPRC